TMDNKFKPGESGNPDGRPKGAKDKRTQYRELFEPHADALIQKAIDLALAGDTTCLKMCIDRLVSPFRAKNATVTLDDIEGSLTEKGEKIITAMGNGEVTPADTSSMLSALAAQARIIEIEELEKRVSDLEARNHN
ncbi:MAG: hypothetical protein IH836_08375, partial [Proteobacteria bacterium]|nr:hypothetical protein [Pseudomonadota bacterium]